MVGCVSGCVGMAGCHTLLHLCKSVLSVGDPSLQEASVRSVGSVGIQFAHGIHRTHRSLVALVAAWVWQDAIPSYICVNPCNLWETLLCKKLLRVPWVLWEYSSPTDCTDQHRWVVALILPRNSQNSQKFGVLLAAWVRQDAIPSYICVNPCYLWETFLCKKLLCVPWVLWEYHCLLGWCSRDCCTP